MTSRGGDLTREPDEQSQFGSVLIELPTRLINPPPDEVDPEKRQKNINKAMAKLLKDFPPKPKK